MDDSKDDDRRERVPAALARRDLIRLGAGVLATALTAKSVSAQRGVPPSEAPPPGSPPSPVWRPHTGPGYTNDANRLDANGPMDDTTRKIVQYVNKFGEADMTPGAIKATNRAMVDSVASAIAGFEEEAVRVSAKMAKYYPAGPLKCSVMGYGLTATPELAAFVNSAMVRMVDFNETSETGHPGNLNPAAWALGEALHSTGAEVHAAMALGYEIMTVPGSGESVAPAIVAGKLMKLDEDRLANAVSLALVPHVALNKGVGAMSMWKGTRSAEAIKCGVWAAMLAREGMTGPPQPFEGRGSLWYSQGRMGRAFTLPERSRLAIERVVNKRFPSDQQTQQILANMPEIRAWTKYDEIASVEYYMPFGDWEEVGDAPKWDPRNRDTADHSMPYVLARNLISGESYLDAFSDEKLPYKDPVVRELINKITLAPVAEWRGNGTGRIVIRKKTGEERFWDNHSGKRDPGEMADYPQMSDEDITAKFTRVCAYRQVSNAQRDQMLKLLWDLRAVKDFADVMRTMAAFGKPLPL
jgi:2-methylcitrate dehydratase